MGFDFAPKKKAAGDFHLGAFSWPWMMEHGVGLVLGYAEGVEPGTFVSDFRKCQNGSDSSPAYNDGFPVSAQEAKWMASAARGLARAMRYRQQIFDGLTPERRKQIEDEPLLSTLYKRPVRPDFVAKCDEFAEWAEKSGGFEIH